MNETAELQMDVETERIKALKKYDILDTPPDGSFDRITRLACNLLKVPIAIVSLVDTDRIWFKSRYGLDVNQIDRDPGLCASAILSDELYLVEDAIKDPRTLANPLVAGDFGLRFYAALPLKTTDGHNLGTFCILDKNSRKMTAAQKEILQELTDIVMDQMELRLAARKAINQQNQILNIAAHDLKNPLATISLRADLMKREKNNPDAIDKMCGQLKESSLRMTRIINELLETARVEADKIRLRFVQVDFADIVERVVATNHALADNKFQKLQLHIESRPMVCADESKLAEIADNLINNAIKYSPKDKNITIRLKKQNGKAILEVQDEGQGLTAEDKKCLFQRFTRLSAKPTGGENSTGLGLSIVKVLVEAQHGTVRAVSEGKDKGATFVVEMPVMEE